MLTQLSILALAVFILVTTTSSPAHAVQRSFLNNGFESIWAPLVGTNTNYCFVFDGSLSPWLSNDGTSGGVGPCNGYNGGSYGTGTNIVEIWFNNFNGVPARSGKVHAELNANSASTIHQNVCVLQNEDITWRLSHRGRDGVDRMNFYVGASSAVGMVLDASTGNTGATTINGCQNGTSVTPVSGCTQSTTNTWGDYSGVFKWLGSSQITSVNFQAISTNGGAGSLTVGNFLDEVYFYLKPIVEFSASNSSGAESVATPAAPKLRVVGALTAPLTVSVSVTGGTAVLGTDYTTPNGLADFTVTIPVGNYIETDSFDTGIQIVNDRVANGDRTIIMQVNANSAYIISSSQTCGGAVNNTATYTILDDDATVRLSNTTIGGTGTFNYTLTNVDTNLVTAGNQTAASITTAVAGTPVEYDADSNTAGTQPIAVVAVGTAVTITETVPVGWTVSGSCSVTGGSNPTTTPIAISTAGLATIPAANVTAGAVIACSYVNNYGTASVILSKAFSAGTIGVGQTARLTFTISNPIGSRQSNLALYDSFPSGLVVAATPNVTTTCTNLVHTTNANQTYFNPTGFRVNANSNCTISVNVTSTSEGTYTNGSPQITSITGMTNAVTDQTLNVVQAGLTKAFNPTTIDPGGTSTLTFTLTNGSGNPAQTGINFRDTLPTNVTVAGTPAITTTCPSGTGVVATTAGTVTITGATMSNDMATCTITVNVTSSTPGGPYTNSNGSISNLARINNNVTDSSLTVRGVTLTKSFNTGTITAGQTARLTFAIQNPSGSTAKTGLSFTDTFPAGLVVAATPNVVNTCGGTTPAPAGGATSFVVASVNAAAGASTCTISVDVTSNSPTTYINGAGQISVTAPLLNGVTDQTLVVTGPFLTVIKTAYGVTSTSTAKSGQDIPYVITVTNTGTGKAWEVKVTDAISPYSALKVIPAPVLTFTDGTISSGISMTNSTVSYSSNNGGTWTTATPADQGGGYNGDVTNWMITFDPAVQMNSDNAFFTITYSAKVK